jgi:uncharacterized RDD family membrane protein YckC
METENQPRKNPVVPSSKKKDVSFTPLSDGLGFHPFADGLPYAPLGNPNSRRDQYGSHVSHVSHVSKDQPLAAALNPAVALHGTGAVAAGRPIPVTSRTAAPSVAAAARAAAAVPPAAPPRVSVPVASAKPANMPPMAPRSPVLRGATPAASQPERPLQQQQQQLLQAPGGSTGRAELNLPYELGFGYLIRRVLAFFADLLLNTSVCVLALAGVSLRQDLSWDALVNPNVLLLAILFFVMFNWAVVTAQEVVFGTTLGKRMFGLVIRGDTSAVFLRSFFFLPSIIFCGLGVLWAIFDRRKRCWHDHAVDLQPIELAEL